MEITDASICGLAEYGKAVRSALIGKVKVPLYAEWEREIDSIIPIRHVKKAGNRRSRAPSALRRASRAVRKVKAR